MLQRSVKIALRSILSGKLGHYVWKTIMDEYSVMTHYLLYTHSIYCLYKVITLFVHSILPVRILSSFQIFIEDITVLKLQIVYVQGWWI